MQPAAAIRSIQQLLLDGDAPGAARSAREAAAAFPDLEAFPVLLASALAAQGRYADVEAESRRALARFSASFELTLALVTATRSTLRPEVAADALRALVARRPDFPPAWACLAQQLNYTPGVEPAEVRSAHARFGALLDAAARGRHAPLAVTLDPDRPLRVGVLSADLRRHSVAHFLLPLASRREAGTGPDDTGPATRAGAVEFEWFFTGTEADEVTRRLARAGQPFTNLAGASAEQVAHALWARRVDVVIECNGPGDGSRLSALALRPAPLQLSYCGYPATTGCPFIDARLVDGLTDPVGPHAGTAHLAAPALDPSPDTVEPLLRLAGCFLAFTPLDPLPAVDTLDRAGGGPFTFGCFNQVYKLSGPLLDDWAAILRAAPGTRLILKAAGLGQAGSAAAVAEAFRARGVEPARVDCVPWVAAPADHLAAYARVDLALDTHPYHGTTTTCEALAMGVPVLTLAGRLHAGRVGVSLLHAAGEPGLVASSRAGYVQYALAAAALGARVGHQRQALARRVRSSTLMDGPGLRARLAEAIRLAWRARVAAARAG